MLGDSILETSEKESHVLLIKRISGPIACTYSFRISSQADAIYCLSSVPYTKEEQRIFEMFENRVLKRIFGPKREEVVGDWRRLHSEELHNLCASSILW
jgi:hypothetical protein